MHDAGMATARRILLVQLLASMVVALLLLLISVVDGYSGLIGGLIATLANGYFATRIFAPYRAQQPGRLVSRFYGAEFKKLLLTGLLFVGAIEGVHPLSVGGLFGAYLIVQLASLLAGLSRERFGA